MSVVNTDGARVNQGEADETLDIFSNAPVPCLMCDDDDCDGSCDATVCRFCGHPGCYGDCCQITMPELTVPPPSVFRNIRPGVVSSR